MGFLVAFLGTYLIAVTGNFGFLAPVLARESPAVLDSITQYPPAVGINGLAAVAFMIGYALFGIAMMRIRALPRLAGLLVAVGAPAHLLGFGLSQLVATAWWVVAVLGAVSLGARPGLGGLPTVANRVRLGSASSPAKGASIATGTLTSAQPGPALLSYHCVAVSSRPR